VTVFRERIVPRLLQVPLKKQPGTLYQFTSGFYQYLAAHKGSMVDPGTFLPPLRPRPQEVFLSPSLETSSRRLHQLLGTEIKLAVGLTPLPRSLAAPGDRQQRDQVLREWNQWLQADCLLTNLPAQLPDALFAGGAHLNQSGQERFTRLLGEALAPLLSGRARARDE
jgi:hypothetical protein